MHIESFILAAGASKRTGKINKLTKKYKNFTRDCKFNC